jgi:hypothetical protein
MIAEIKVQTSRRERVSSGKEVGNVLEALGAHGAHGAHDQ